MGKWFILNNETVEGPYTTEDLDHQESFLRLYDDTQVWGPSLQEWVSYSLWREKKDQLIQRQGVRKDLKRWHLAFKGQQKGPMTRNQAVQMLNELPENNKAFLWTKGMKQWAPVYEFPDMMEAAGITRRQHPRAQIEGQAIVTADEQTSIFQLDTISVGGCGLTNAVGLQAGQSIALEIRASDLGDPLRLKAEVVYVSETDYAGVKFAQAHMEAQSKIVQYIRSQSGDTHTNEQVA